MERKLSDDEARSQALEAKIGADSAELDRRAGIFHDEVVRALGSSLLTEGDEILAASCSTALLLDLPVMRRPDPRQVEKIGARLRQAEPGVIDVRPVKQDDSYVVTVSAIPPAGSDASNFPNVLRTETETAIARIDPKLLTFNGNPSAPRFEPAVTLDLMILEDPIPTYVSPITRVVNAVLGLFGDAPNPRHRLEALARSVRLAGPIEQLDIQPAATPKTLAVTAVLSDSVPPASRGDSSRIRQLLQAQAVPDDVIRRAQTLFNAVEEAAGAQRLTLAHPSLATGYAPMKYDYMSGYLWMFVMGSLGIAVTIGFRRAERLGLVRKRGVEEADQS